MVVSSPSKLSRPRLSSEDIRALIDSANKTHESYKNGTLLASSRARTSFDKESGSCSRLLAQETNNGASLPDNRHSISARTKQQIIESVTANRLTIIVGPTGESARLQVPSLLLELGGAILCTQPQGRKRIGGEVEICNHITRTWPEALLQALQTNGANQMLSQYRVLVVDEGHERSAESDLILCLVKRFWNENPISQLRLVLMSTSLPQDRYGQYFECKRVETITLDLGINQITAQELYLADFLPRLSGTDFTNFARRMRLNPDAELIGERISPQMLSLIKSLVAHLDHVEPQSSPFVIYAPPGLQLEQIYQSLRSGGALKVSALVNKSMQPQQQQGNRRRVFLATEDVSVTIPACVVIDLCRTATAGNKWANHAICNQRKGGSGKVFRLLHKGFYLSRLAQVPQITFKVDHVLGLVVCSSIGSVGILSECLDPPEPRVVEDAIRSLQDMGAVEQSIETDDALVPTRYGCILANVGLSIKDANIVLSGAQLGLLHETLALRAIYHHKPIVCNYGESNATTLESYYRKAMRERRSCLAQFSAYMFWDFEWNQRRRRVASKQFWEQHDNDTSSQSSSESSSGQPVWKWTPELEEEHARWCKGHDINPKTVRVIADIVENTMNVLFKYEPEWLRCADPAPIWKRPYDWKGTTPYARDMLYRVYGPDATIVCDALLELSENRIDVAACFCAEIIEATDYNLACVHYLQGYCKYGNYCRHLHTPLARRPPCRYFRAGSCTMGRTCLFSHHDARSVYIREPVSQGPDLLTAKLPFLPQLSIMGGPARWFRDHHARTLMLGEGNFEFTQALHSMGIPPYMSSTNVTSCAVPPTCLKGVDVTRLHTDERIIRHIQSNCIDTFAWNFPSDQEPEALLLEAFHSIALLMTYSETAYRFKFAIALQGDQFSRWNVLYSAAKTGWRLSGWSAFDHSVFEGYECGAKDAKLYVFNLHKGGR